jgi:hypothetical protein
MPEDFDKVGERELALYVENDADLYRRQYQPILKNLTRKKAAGTYDREKAVKLFMYLMESGAKKYLKEFGAKGERMQDVFPKPVREAAAREFRDSFEVEYKLGNYEEYVPKKYQAVVPAMMPTSGKSKSKRTSTRVRKSKSESSAGMYGMR